MHYTRLEQVGDGYVVLTARQEDESIIFSPRTKREMASSHFTPTMPPQMKARLTLVLKKLDQSLFEYNQEEMIEEINSTTPNVNGKVEEIYKMQGHSIIKIKMADTTSAQRLKDNGMRIFNISITPQQIEYERFTAIVQCMKCYSYQHTTNKCNVRGIKCSECAATTHTWKECTANNKKCASCGGPHRTFSSLCEKRREVITSTAERNAIREEEKNNKLYTNTGKEYRGNTEDNKGDNGRGQHEQATASIQPHHHARLCNKQ